MGCWLVIKRREVLIQAAAGMCSETQAGHKAEAVCCLHVHFRAGKRMGMEGDQRLPGAEGGVGLGWQREVIVVGTGFLGGNKIF